MNSKLKNILSDIEDFSSLTKKHQKQTLSKLEYLASKDSLYFEKTISGIKPSNNSILFEVYEALSLNPEKWIRFIIIEFKRIKKITEESDISIQEEVASPLLALSFFLQKEFYGIHKLTYELKNGTKSSSIILVKLSMDLLNDAYFLDEIKFKDCKYSIIKQLNSKNKDVVELAKVLLKDKEVNTIEKITNFILDNSSYFWGILLFIIISYKYGLKTGFISSALLISGFSLGFLIIKLLGVILKRIESKSVYKELFLFITTTVLLYLNIENKRLLIFILPLCLPIIISGLFSLRN